MFTNLITKECPKCRLTKELSLFSKNKSNKGGYAYECKACHAERIKDLRKREPEKFKERAKKWRETNPDYVADWKKRNKNKTKAIKRRDYLKNTYGITVEQYDAMRQQQNYCCYTCGKHENNISNAGPTALNVDHCHSSNQLRKLLCMGCNIALGKVNDDIHLLEKLISYLKEHDDKEKDIYIDDVHR